MVIYKFNNGGPWRPPFCLANHVTKIENTNLHILAHILHLKSEQYCFKELEASFLPLYSLIFAWKWLIFSSL